MRIEQFLSESALRHGPRAAIVAEGRSHSYAELARSSDRVAAALLNRGVRRGDRIALFMDGNFETVVSAFAVLKAGAVVSPIDPATDADGLARILGETNASGIVTEARRASVAAAAIATAHSVKLVVLCGGDRSTAEASCLCFEELVGGIGPAAGVERAGPPGDPAILLQTEHADGAAAAKTLSHADLVAAAARIDCGSERNLASVLSHHGLCQLLGAIRAGATLVLESSVAFRQTVFSRTADENEAVLALAS